MKIEFSKGNEIVDSTSETYRERLTTPIYGTFAIFWAVIHWELLFVAFFVSEQNIYLKTGFLKNEYLVKTFFNYHELGFWLQWLLPFAFTYIAIWKLPGWLLLKAYNVHQNYLFEKRSTVFKYEQKIEKMRESVEKAKQDRLRLEEANANKTADIEAKAPPKQWSVDFDKLEKSSIYPQFHKLMDAVYYHNGKVRDDKHDNGRYAFEVPKDILMYADTVGLVTTSTDKSVIELTDKGRFFIQEFFTRNNVLAPV